MSNVVFTPPGAGSQPRPLDSKLTDILFREDYDTLANATAAVAASGGGVLNARGNLSDADASALLPTNVSLEQNGPEHKVSLFNANSARARKSLSSHLRFNDDTTAFQLSAFHVGVRAEGSSANGPAKASLGMSMRLVKEGFGAGTAKGGEIDGLYIVVRQDSPRTGAQGATDPNRGDACGALIDVAVYENVGFVGGVEGATSVLANATGQVSRRMSYQIGCTDTTTASSIGYFASASLGQHSAGMLIYNAEGSGGNFTNFIQCGTDTGTVFNIDRTGIVSLGRHVVGGTTSSTRMNLRVNQNGALGFLNSSQTTEIALLSQTGQLTLANGLTAPNVTTTGDVSAGNAVITKFVQFNKQSSVPAAVQGRVYQDAATGKLRVCEDGVNYRTIVTQ